MEPRRNLRLLLEYHGGHYHGWQRQKNALTVQEVVERALFRLTQENVRLNASGRTDAGVHALGQVANFQTFSKLPLPAFHRGLNSLLPPDIAVLEVQEAPPDFHARYWAKHKTYEYRLLNRPSRSPLHEGLAWWLPGPLDLAALRQAASYLMGEQDFTAFRASGGRPGQARRRVLAAAWEGACGDLTVFTITANGFLRGMVRSLVGTMVQMGQGKRPPQDMLDLLHRGARHLAGPTAPPQGLYLVEVAY
jgi:tRNA pseudouridine38-40 synthase